ncbi:Predicted transcriptional regulator, ArsR family [Geodermatophilus africanus]|uniref:Predicted transcriptional regulator, ArsR family n=1 Tax=Geodermatophilus africanus TaxID=1137993 RepID=A0A1H3BLC3_9ACTN|nr:metalloregulator ArsR/SmtB family transcription factor [Geodermatophilus africanus]SDX42687.1 Predicted transcriptional regulator, ArsR family [Geodermatophilus africanus]
MESGTVQVGGGVGTPPRPSPSPEDGRTRDRVSALLLEHGPQTATELAGQLGVSPTAVRRHLDALVATGRVEERHAPGTPRGRGRPARLFHLTDAGRSAFPHAYDDLALTALRFVAAHGGPDAVRAVAEAQLAGLEQRCSAAVEAVTGAPVDRAQALAGALTAEGYAASASAISGGGQLCQHHCPVAHVAAEFPQLCEAETAVIGRLVGTHVQRLATIAHGDGVCTTHIPGPVRRRYDALRPRPEAHPERARGEGDGVLSHTRAGNRSGPASPVPDERAAHRLRAGGRPAPSTSSTPTNDRERTPA